MTEITIVCMINPYTDDEQWIEDDYALWRTDRDAWDRKHAALEVDDPYEDIS